jgi:hypothetical protein
VTSPLTHPRPLDALNRVLSSVESVRNGRAACGLLATFAATGLAFLLAPEERDKSGAP